MSRLAFPLLCALLMSSSSSAVAACLLPDDGAGTIALPPNCMPDGYQGELDLVDGLPAGGNVDISAQLLGFLSTASPGGILGGTIETFTATMQVTIVGTGTLSGLNRSFTIPASGEMHVASHPTGVPFQSFPVTIYRLKGKVTNDYDFWLFEFEGGDVYGLDSPGHVTLTEQPGGDFSVQGFFDFNYRIQFEGAQESLYLDGYRGITLDLESTFELASATSVPARRSEASLHVFPSPMSHRATLVASLPEYSPAANVSVFDLRGRRVRTVTPGGLFQSGTLSWDGTNDSGRRVASGTYLVVLEAGATRVARKLTLAD